MAFPLLARLAAVTLIVGVILSVGPADRAAAQSDIFTVSGIEVDATADKVTDARQAAIADGQRQAFNRLMHRLVPEADWPSLSPPSAAALQEMISDFSVANERSSDVRYLAELTFRFVPDAVRRHLRQTGVDFAETQSKPLLVIPLYREGGGEALLWEEPNPWRTVWSLAPPDGGLVPFVAPIGDLADISSLDAEQALRGDEVSLAAIAGRYGVSEVLIALADVSGDPASGQATVAVSAARQGIAEQSQDFSLRVGPLQDEAFDQQLLRAADALSVAVQEAWKAENLLVLGEEGLIDIRVPVSSLSDWLTVKRKVARIPLVRSSRLVVLRRYEALISVIYFGDLTQLSRAFAQEDLLFAPSDRDDFWELRLTSAAAPASAGVGAIE